MAAKFVEYAVDHLAGETKEGGSAVVYQDSKCKLIPIEVVNSGSYQFDEKMLEMAKDMMR
ncbi:MAG: hypothetical protein PHO65_06195 [Sulfurovum sp.]|nr:hypothetical protein [Sulfurovum sp.]